MNETLLELDIVGIGLIEFPVYDSQVYWQREIPFAVFIFIYCVFFILLQLLVMNAMLNDSETRKFPAYQIMFVISVTDTVQLLIHFSAVYYIVDSTPHFTAFHFADYPLSALVREWSAKLSLADVVFSIISHSAIFPFIYFVLGVSLVHIAGYVTWEYLPIPWDQPIGVFLGHFVWMLWNSINPLLYIFLNKRIRTNVLISLGRESAKNKVSLVQSSVAMQSRPTDHRRAMPR
ncbi:unnamed protein product [Caenorhabditis auriculariae]|uniref:G protein-coupled receptor n=1 Tax=Caenorhabditis auriculariae TaxID=2777116 RepID=A0A8S1HLX2_9PELO|nr:unnamed protein product [Caenorhabditis auriculariae]